MPRSCRIGILLLCLSLFGCSKKVSEPTEVLTSFVPPAIVASQPAARSVGVLYDTDIWVQFDRALEPSSVNVRTVFFKQDTRRLAATVSYEGLTRRILVRPTAVLDLGATYTVELSPRVRAFQGDSLGTSAFFQFTTNTLRRVHYDFPLEDAREGLVTSLGWSGNGPINSNITYELYASVDSAAVVNRTVPYRQRSVILYHLPREYWPQGATVFWSVTAVNLTTGERLDGPVTKFRTYPVGTPVDSMIVHIQDWGGRQAGLITQFCSSPTLPISTQYNSGIRFLRTVLPSTLQVASARVELPVPDAYMPSLDSTAPVLQLAQNDWSSCLFTYPGPPFPETNGVLATGASSATPNCAVFEGAALGAFFEGQARLRPYNGVLVRSPQPAQFQVSTQALNGVVPRAVIYFYPPGSDTRSAAR